jgi:serine/threonine protein kinase
MPNHFLASGVYGCVYYPGYTCKGVGMKKKKFVSKLTLLNDISQTEIDVGLILKKTSQYEDNFVLVERQCPIQYKSLSEMKEGCDMIEKRKQFVLLYSRFVRSKELYQYLKENTLFIRMYRCFYQLCEKISVMIESRVVHHDLHFGNILYGTESSKLYVIDFGLSMIVDKMNSSDYLKYTFSRYMPTWNWYPLEIHILSYLIQHGDLTREVVLSAIDTYLKDHRVLNMFKDFQKEFKRRSIEYFLSFVGRTREDCVEYLLRFWNTWDHYDIGLRFLNLYSENDLHYPEYLETLLQMVHPNPEKRPTALQLRNMNKKSIQSFDLSSSNKQYHSVSKYLSFSQEKKSKMDFKINSKLKI